MSELVQGVKLKFELPFKLPAPVSFPFELIGDFRPITRIPKYDYSLEKKIVKEIAKQKQEDQFNMLKQAQQQLSMVDLIASRKNRHKGKAPDRNSMVSTNTDPESQLLKPSSESGVSRLQNSAPAEAAASRPEQPWNQQQRPRPATPLSALAASTATPADELAAVPALQVERPHSAGPSVPVVQPSTGAGAGVSSHPIQHLGPVQYPTGPQQSSPARPVGPYRPPMSTQVPVQRPPNSSAAFAARPIFSQQPQTGSIPTFASGSGPAPNNTNMGFHSMADLPLNRPQPQFQSRPQGIPIQHQQRQQQQQQQQPMLQPPSSGFNNRFSTSFGVGPVVGSSSPANTNPAPSQPALPPKPDEWKPQPFNMVSSAAESQQPPFTSAEVPPPVPPRRNWNQSQNQNQVQSQGQQEPRPPALPPKPSAFTEFDYAVDGPDGMESSEATGHVEQLGTLLSMGFSRPQAIHALEMYDYDVNKASNYLIDKAMM